MRKLSALFYSLPKGVVGKPHILSLHQRATPAEAGALFTAHRFYTVFKENLDFPWTTQTLHNADSKHRMIHQ